MEVLMTRGLVLFVATICSSTSPFSLAAAAPLYRGDFETATATGVAAQKGQTAFADYTKAEGCSQASQVRIVNNPVRQGELAVRFLLRDDLPGSESDVERGKERCELSMKQPFVANYNETRWFAWSLYIPKTSEFEPEDAYPTAITHWQTHTQIMRFVESRGQYHAQFGLLPTYGGKWKVEVSGGPEDRIIKKEFQFGSSDRGVWHDFLMEYHLHNENGSALTRLWYRKAGDSFSLVVDYTGANLRTLSGVPAGDYSYNFKTGLYRGVGQNGDQVIYVDGPWVGRNESDVLPFFSKDPVLPSGQILPPSGLSVDG
jgi:hypothetical protein